MNINDSHSWRIFTVTISETATLIDVRSQIHLSILNCSITNVAFVWSYILIGRMINDFKLSTAKLKTANIIFWAKRLILIPEQEHERVTLTSS